MRPLEARPPKNNGQQWYGYHTGPVKPCFGHPNENTNERHNDHLLVSQGEAKKVHHVLKRI